MIIVVCIILYICASCFASWFTLLSFQSRLNKEENINKHALSVLVRVHKKENLTNDWVSVYMMYRELEDNMTISQAAVNDIVSERLAVVDTLFLLFAVCELAWIWQWLLKLEFVKFYSPQCLLCRGRWCYSCKRVLQCFAQVAFVL